ncbi:MAG: MBL fold metallo-hydrolase [Actinobacteria bacterium]|nr:MBL fold metallo-hydrolase [Actinomycetota bacterium]
MNKYGKYDEIITINMVFVNSYIIKGNNKIIIVDAGLPGNAGKIVNKIKDIGFNISDISLIILTHAHLDHFGSLKKLKDMTKAKIAVHKEDAAYLSAGKSAEVVPVTRFSRIMMSMIKKIAERPADKIKIDILIEDELDLNIFGISGKVISTPGHTDGSVAIFLDSGKCMVGDTIGSSFGRPIAGMYCKDMKKMKDSINIIKKLNAKEIYLSHGGILNIEKIQKYL